MTTDLVPFKGQKMATAFSAYEAPDESLSDGIGASFGVIGYRGKEWSLRYRGELHKFTRSDDGSPLSYIDVIILRQAHTKSRSYYDGFDQESLGKRPICASLNYTHPDNDVQQQQAQTCAICPRNVWHTSPDGRKKKDCSDYKRLAILLLPSLSKTVLGEALMEPVFLRVPAASLNELAIYGDTLAAQGYKYFAVITRISFVAGKAHPQFAFRAVQLLSDAEAPVVLPLREDPVTLRITGEAVQVQHALAAPPLNPEFLLPGQLETGFNVPMTKQNGIGGGRSGSGSSGVNGNSGNSGVGGGSGGIGGGSSGLSISSGGIGSSSGGGAVEAAPDDTSVLTADAELDNRVAALLKL